jgi:hypothetical protein
MLDGVYEVLFIPETSGVNHNGYQQSSHLLNTRPQMMMMKMMMVMMMMVMAIEQTEISTCNSSNITFEAQQILTTFIRLDRQRVTSFFKL